MATTEATPAAPPGTTRRTWWRAPAGEPAYALPALLALLALGALVYAWGIANSPFHMFYADAARSMSQSWKAFFFGSFDPSNSITLDKLPGFLWPQALSARIFGFHSWALTLPQVLEGVGSMAVLYVLVKRWMGVNAALLACGMFLCIPAADGLFRTQTEDPMFTLCVLLAALATQKAAQSGRLRSLVLAGVWVGIGFQAKMLEAWVVLPALAVVYLVMAPATLRKRILHVVTAGVVTLAVSSVWVLVVTLVPAEDRPYVDGTTDNSAFSMVVGYNFLNRFSSVGLDAGGTGSISSTQGGHGGRPAGPGNNGAASSRRGQDGPSTQGGGAQGNAAQGFPSQGGAAAGDLGENGWGKMFGAALASQTGWLYPLAALAIALGLVWRRREPRTDPVRGGFLLWGLWLATYFLVFSAGAVGGHTYYMGVIAVPSAALAGGGIILMWRAYRQGGARVWALPTAVGVTSAWGAWIAAQFPAYGAWLTPASLLLGLGAVVALVLGRPRGATGADQSAAPQAGHRAVRRVALVGLLTGLGSFLIAPATWAAQVFAPGNAMTSMMGSVGPSSTSAGWGGGNRIALAGGRGTTDDAGRAAPDGDRPTAEAGSRAAGAQGGFGPGGFGGGASGGGSTTLSPAQQALLDYTESHKGGATYDFATTSWSAASPYILDAGADVLPMGGFSGQVPFPSQQDFQQLIRSGQLKFVLTGGSGGMGAFFGGGATGPAGAGKASPATALTQWVTANCAVVPAQDYAASGSTASAASPSGGVQNGAQALYECIPKG